MFMLLAQLAVAEEMRQAPNIAATPANQLSVSGNACGPAALLNAFRMGNPGWMRVADSLPGSDDKQRILSIIRTYGMRPSSHLANRARWSRGGVGVADLTDMGNEMIRGRFLPTLVHEVFFLKPRETPEKLVARVHQRMEKSLAKGLPPVLSIRRYAHRRGKAGTMEWIILEAHFVTITAVPSKLPRDSTSFVVHYLDPWGGKRCKGSIRISETELLATPDNPVPCLEVDFPQADVGKKLVRNGEKSAIAASAAIGRW
jgi:hypothetical protein